MSNINKFILPPLKGRKNRRPSKIGRKNKFVERRFRIRKRYPVGFYKQLPRFGNSFIEETPDSEKYVRYAPGIFIDPEPMLFAERTQDFSHGEAPYRIGDPFENFKIVPSSLTGLVGFGTHYSNTTDATITPFGHGRLKYVGGHQLTQGDWPGVDGDTNWLCRPDIAKAVIADANWPTWRPQFVPDTHGLESSAWSRTMPKLEQGGLGVAIAEVRDVPHMLHTTNKGFLDLYKRLGGDMNSKFLSPKHVADHFLNHNFGWVPFASDVNKFFDNVINGSAKIDLLIKNNGTWTHRKTILLDSGTYDQVNTFTGSMFFPANQMYGSMEAPPTYSIWKKTTRHAYGVGRFRYYQPYLDPISPEANNLLGPMRRQLLLHGARLSPATIYRATPWTWLADWVSSSGSIVDSLNAMVLDQMASKYFYLCDKSTTFYELHQMHPWNARTQAPRSLTTVRGYESTVRKDGSPFGFSFAWDNLSPKQLAILAALGVSRH